MGGVLRVKICGVTRPADARAAAEAGADAIGLNFHPASPRCVGDAAAAAILRELPPLVAAVGVFVEVPHRAAAERVQALGRITTVQMHGRQLFPPDCEPLQFIPAFAVRDAAGLEEVTRYLEACRQAGCLPAAVLVDGYAAGLAGGTGRTVPWDLLAEFRPPVPLILAGGLTPDNVAEAVRRVRPYAVDVAGGVESSPGVKDPEKMRRFVDNARTA
jgi:phosphoribosylanthranilate isomerase